MSSAPADRITLELEPGEPIRGRVLNCRGEEQPFHGWLELTAALDRAREDLARLDAPPDRAAPGPGG